MPYRNMQQNDGIPVTVYNEPSPDAKNTVADDESAVTPSSGSAYDIIDMEMLCRQRRILGLSHQKIADSFGASEPAIRKFFNCQNKNPSFYNVYHITVQLGLSLDVITGLRKPDDHPGSSAAYYEEILKIKDEQIADLEGQRDRYREHFTAENDKIRSRAALQYEEQNKIITDLNRTVESHADDLRKANAEIDRIQNRSRIKTWIIGVGVGVAVLLLVVDALLGNIGWIRYDGGLQTILFG